jgi:hypothetical protein
MARWFLGSVAEGVMRRSPAPVLLVRSGPVAEDAPAVEEMATTATTG